MVSKYYNIFTMIDDGTQYIVVILARIAFDALLLGGAAWQFRV